ncbi:hypothetical protein [Alkaliphilus metalliredigens]|uniref:hypothetical protein n=1 Tax=Alkaliphilus metalliredigens TaxID=208226 RepID=UPI00005CAD5E|nr:hypothetical protein [Alkaliphilus metalliredigens]
MSDMPLYAFYPDSELGKYFWEDNINIEASHSRYMPETDELLTVREMIELYNLPHINEEDLENLAYAVRFSTGIGNIEAQHINAFGFREMSYFFNGEIWILTNEKNYSVAALFALPNTGIVLRWDIDYLTDHEGRALNEFTPPPR